MSRDDKGQSAPGPTPEAGPSSQMGPSTDMGPSADLEPSGKLASSGSREPTFAIDSAAPEAIVPRAPKLPRRGDVLADRYYLSTLIGQGGYATVFEGSDNQTGTAVAIKVMKPETLEDPTLLDRFRQEVTLVRELEHPNTIKVTDLGTTEEGCLFMVQEFLRGSTIEEFIAEEGPLSPARAAHVLEQVLGSLAEAHSKEIVHRDLKPENIMITEMAGEKDFVKVLDFGISKSMEPERDQVKTATGVVFCTPQYAAPEILTGRRATPASDVYSLGFIAIELLSGTHVVEAESVAQIIAFQLSDDPVPIPEALRETGLGALLRKAVEKNPVKRFRDAREMYAALRALDRRALQSLSTVTGASAQTVVDPEFQRTSFAEAETAKMAPEGRHIDHHAPTARLSHAPTVPARVEPTSRSPLLLVGLFALVGFCVLAAILFANRNPTDTQQGAAPAETETPLLAEVGEPPVVEETEPQPRSPEAPPPTRLSASEILATRLAASDWETGAWLGDLPREAMPSARVRVETEPAATDVPEGTGTPAMPVLGVEEEAARLALLFQSAQASQQAISLLQSAIAAGDIGDTDRVAAASELIRLSQNFLQALLGLERCDAAERRLERAIVDARALGMGDQVRIALEPMRPEIEACHAQRQVAMSEWDPSTYMSLVREAEELCRETDGLPETEIEAEREILYRCVHARQSAIALLDGALTGAWIPDAQLELARAERVHLQELVLSTLLQLDLAVVAQIELEDTLERPELLPEGEAAPLLALGEQISEEISPRNELAEGTGEAAGWDVSRFNLLAAKSASMLQEAAAIVPEPPPEPEPLLYSANVRLTSRPSRARVLLDGEQIGRTPFEGVIESEEETVVISLQRGDYHTERLRLTLTDGDIERRVELEAAHPFGQTGRIGDD